VKVVAADFGFGWTKALALGHKPVCIPSLVGAAEFDRFQDDDVVPENGHSTASIKVAVDGRWYFVGELAGLQSASRSQTLNPARTGSTEQKALFYGVASELVRTVDQQIVVICGLPVLDFDARNKKALSDMLRGHHEVKREGRHARSFEVADVHPMPQALGTLYGLVLDRHGKLIDGDLAGGRVGIIDPGHGTTNFIMCDRMRYVETGSGSIPSGMSEALVKIAKDLKREYGLDYTNNLTRVDKEAVRARTVKVKGVPVNVAHIVEPHIADLADTLISQARSLWGEGEDLHAVVLTGGGSVELARFFQQVYSHLRLPGGDVQLANVTGFLRAGIRRFGE